MDILGQRVMNVQSHVVGTVIEVDQDIITVSFHGRECKYKIPSWINEEENKEPKSLGKKKQIEEPKYNSSKEPQTSIELVKEFFEKSGLEVVDCHEKTGELWVIGGQRKIKKIVDEACLQFGIHGEFAHGKATKMQPGWVTKLVE